MQKNKMKVEQELNQTKHLLNTIKEYSSDVKNKLKKEELDNVQERRQVGTVPLCRRATKQN